MKTSRRIAYRLMRRLAVTLSRLPSAVLYRLSDMLAWLARDVVRYRRRVIRANLDSAFPELPEAERRLTERRFYSFLADCMVETLRLASMTRAEMERRMTFSGIPEVASVLASGRHVTLYLGHYGNWEWISSIPLHFDPSVIGGQIYHPLENGAADRLMGELRSRFGAVNIPMESTLRTLLGWRREGRVSMVGYIADQVPLWTSIHHWVDFLNHDTPVFNGAERIARRLDTAVFYVDVTRPRRGEWHAAFEPVCLSAAVTPEGWITDEYYRRLEATIRRAPQYWLWSHNRWKRTRPQWHEWLRGCNSDRARAILASEGVTDTPGLTTGQGPGDNSSD